MHENNQTHNVGIPKITMSPGEGQRALHVILDADWRISQVYTYTGVKRQSSEFYTTVVKSELRNVRRGCRTDKLFFNYKKLKLIKIRNSILPCLRKRRASSAMSAANVLDEVFMGNLMTHDDGYRIFKDIRTSMARAHSTAHARFR